MAGAVVVEEVVVVDVDVAEVDLQLPRLAERETSTIGEWYVETIWREGLLQK